MANFQPNPHEVRENARRAQYPNSTTEREVLAEIDNAVWDRVRVHEDYIAEAIQNGRKGASADMAAADLFVDQVRTDVVYPLTEGRLPTADLAQRYRTLKAVAEKAIAELERAEEQEALFAAQLDDPYADVVKLWDKWPLLRPII